MGSTGAAVGGDDSGESCSAKQGYDLAKFPAFIILLSYGHKKATFSNLLGRRSHKRTDGRVIDPSRLAHRLGIILPTIIFTRISSQRPIDPEGRPSSRLKKQKQKGKLIEMEINSKFYKNSNLDKYKDTGTARTS